MQATPSCYGSMVASTSEDITSNSSVSTSFTLSKLVNSTTSIGSNSLKQFIEAPAFYYDVSNDMDELKTALRGADSVLESGYQSVIERSRHPFSTSFVLNDDDQFSEEEDTLDESWDGYLTVGADRIKIKDMSDILSTRYAFLSGVKSNDGLTIVTFPDSRSELSTESYTLLITYLLQVPPSEESHRGFAIIVDRRSDRWSAVRNVLLQISTFFPGRVRVVFLIKPEGVLQRALEVGYRGVADNCAFKVVQLESSVELRRYFRADQLTMDVGGLIKYNHLEWSIHRMDIERMKSSATAIAASLNEFGRTLRETENPNDVETTCRVLQTQTAEKDAIKEDFRIAMRKGAALLKSVRQLENKPKPEQLSPTRLHNVTAIERMLVQLEETEKSFDSYWTKHKKRLNDCLQFRQFEENFKKLQAQFADHLTFLEEHRSIGDGKQKAHQLAEEHYQYTKLAMETVFAARELKKKGEELIMTNESDFRNSCLPKCSELERMADSLKGKLEKRENILRMSSDMHDQIMKANSWCRKGVEILTSNVPPEVSSSTYQSSLKSLDEFLEECGNLKLDTLATSSDLNSLMLLTTTETSTLLALVNERIDDIRRMTVARRDVLAKTAAADQKKLPIQVVTPEKKAKKSSKKEQKDVDVKDIQCCSGDGSIDESPREQPKRISYIITELINTERSYLSELTSVVEYYVEPFNALENQSSIPSAIRGKSEIIFGNIRDLQCFHSRYILPELEACQHSVTGICRIFQQYRSRFLVNYRSYCQNQATAEIIRKEHIEGNSFFIDCQKRASHPLPLGAYLLKPVQRITKYQLILKEIEKFCHNDEKEIVMISLKTMLDLLAEINAALNQLHISGFNGDLRVLGPLRHQSDCDVYSYNRKKKAKLSKVQRRSVFLFDGGIMICKRRTPASNQPSALDPVYYEHKLCIPNVSLGFLQTSRTGAGRFEIWDDAKVDTYVVEPIDVDGLIKWIECLKMTVGPHEGYMMENRQRPKSWTSTVSNESSCSTSTRESDSTDSQMDTNGNTQATQLIGTGSFSPIEDVSADISMDTTGNTTVEEIHASGEVELVDSC